MSQRNPLRLLAQPPPATRASGAVQRARIVPRHPSDRPVRLNDDNPWWRDLYHRGLTLSWPRFLLLGGAFYMLANVAFALLYLLDPGGIASARPGAFADAFFFSIQTMATIGYGVLYPTDLYTNLLVTAETLVALLVLALVTGLFFTRFSRPTARVRFSRNVIVAPFEGRPTLQIRVGNARTNQILQADAELLLLRSVRTAEGVSMRRFRDLRLERSHTPILSLTFTIMHVIDEASPLFGATPEELKADMAELLVTVTGIDETMSQTIHARHSYVVDEILFGARFTDMFGFLPDGRVGIDMALFDATTPLETPAPHWSDRAQPAKVSAPVGTDPPPADLSLIQDRAHIAFQEP